MYASISETLEYIRRKTPIEPKVGIILGTGLGKLAEEVEVELSIAYTQLPHFPVSTTESHRGRLILGRLKGQSVVVMQGRFHYYEGYNMQQITLPVRVMKAMGAEYLLLSNASGGLNPSFKETDLMLITDHINLLPEHPLRGTHYPAWGPRFPDMRQAYDPDLICLAREAAARHAIDLHQGVYVAVQGPALETPAEYRYLRLMGGDAVGMSTVPEVIVARQMGMRCMAISVVTDEAFPETPRPVTLQSVVSAASQAEPRLTRILLDVVEGLE
ncbi:MAG: purine-nucleoside phosphorylase, partial [Bacteroidetes bacterium]|jgi:purine-nucleoside phosphorylase|nr:purine-nucleoside phosphorylase [Bacteroidota bacterium]